MVICNRKDASHDTNFEHEHEHDYEHEHENTSSHLRARALRSADVAGEVPAEALGVADRAQGQVRSGGLEIDRLRDVINEYTGMKADFLGLVTFDDPRLLEIPIILPQGAPNEAEMANLADYLIGGGFVLGDVVTAYGEGLEKYGNLIRGKDFWTERLPEDHPVFSAFFDLKGGMPACYSSGTAQGKTGRLPWNYLTGHFVRGRMAGITPGDGGWGWMNDLASGNSTRQLQLAVNILIYALTQEGSITQRLMQMVN